MCWSSERISLPTSTLSPESLHSTISVTLLILQLPALRKTRRKSNSLLLIFLRFGKPFTFLATLQCQDVGSQVYTKVPSQRHGSICLSVRVEITAKLMFVHLCSNQGCAVRPHVFLEMFRLFQMISGSSNVTKYVSLTC